DALTPQGLVASRLKEIAGQKVDRARYQVVGDPAVLDVWITKAIDSGFLGVDLITTSPDPMLGEIVGIALALGPNEACYLPLSHPGADDLLAGGGRAPGQIEEREALARLKTVLEDPGVLKIGHDLKPDVLVLARHGIALAPFDDILLMSY